ncbi:hypothetical protein [Pseudovibrio exalbescens]|uniref:hypothetical protein n=1 Tax=Pseudovibrio exalbescens TaxID=197461 RepID=UPI0023665BED|nr:hypothetical protein [Pseudovibrio exalbescens]
MLQRTACAPTEYALQVTSRPAQTLGGNASFSATADTLCGATVQILAWCMALLTFNAGTLNGKST